MDPRLDKAASDGSIRPAADICSSPSPASPSLRVILTRELQCSSLHLCRNACVAANANSEAGDDKATNLHQMQVHRMVDAEVGLADGALQVAIASTAGLVR